MSDKLFFNHYEKLDPLQSIEISIQFTIPNPQPVVWNHVAHNELLPIRGIQGFVGRLAASGRFFCRKLY